jgi:hypothetical protein
MDGVVNITSPNPVPNAEFMRTLRAAWGRSFGLPAARWMLELGAIALRTETELVLKSRRVWCRDDCCNRASSSNVQCGPTQPPIFVRTGGKKANAEGAEPTRIIADKSPKCMSIRVFSA